MSDFAQGLRHSWEGVLEVDYSMFDLVFRSFDPGASMMVRIERKSPMSEASPFIISLIDVHPRQDLEQVGGPMVVGGSVCAPGNALAVANSFIVQLVSGQ
jgi:hypothetical protein